jgi:L-fuconolactonase
MRERTNELVIVDSHCHVSPGWYEPVESLNFQMERHEVSHAVLVQMWGQFDNGYLFECVRRFPDRFAPVVLVDAARSDAADVLSRLAAEGASGVRLDPTTRSPGSDPFAIWRAAAELSLAVSCRGTASEFASAAFAELVASVPQLPIVLEHLGSVSQPDRDETERAARMSAFALARFPNVFIKVPGLGEFCRRTSPASESDPFIQPEPPLLEIAFAAFGSERMMWGSDYPPVSGREGYGNALHLPLARLAGLPNVTAGDLDRIFGGTALSVFPVRG